MIRKLARLSGTIIFFVTLTCSCNDEVRCLEGIDNPLVIGFYKVEKKITTDSILKTFSAWGTSQPDTLLYNGTKKIQKIRLPLDPSAKSTSFSFLFDSLPGNLQLYYSTSFKQISIECGFYPIFTLDSLKFYYNYADSLHIVNPYVQSSNEENIKIYFTPRSPSGS